MQSPESLIQESLQGSADKQSSSGPALTYVSYLKIDQLLNLQTPMSNPPEHDETLFIIIHQVYELWFKQILHEVSAATRALENKRPLAFLRCLKRIHAIQDVLTQQIGILETMTPNEFNRFRERINPASGLQSFQWRELEFLMGAKYPEYVNFYRNDPEQFKALQVALASPSIYDYFLHYLAALGFAIPQVVLERDVGKLYDPNAEVTKVFANIYENADKYHDLFLILEAMLDLDQKFLLWRYRHVSMVERMIGSHRGTGGSSGVKYLTTTLNKRYFPEIWELRNSFY